MSDWLTEGLALGFAFVASGPLVRSSYHAAEGFVAAQLTPTAAPSRALPDLPDGQPLIPASALVRR